MSPQEPAGHSIVREDARAATEMPLEFRLHGRGGQGAVTGAKILAAVFADLGKSVQAFGEYAGERSGAPVRAYLRVGERSITSRNKVVRPDHLLVFDPSLLGDAAIAGLRPGGTLLVNTAGGTGELAERFAPFRIAAVDATSIARGHGIGTRSVVIVNTTMAGAFARAHDLPFEAVERAFLALGLEVNLPAAREAHDAVAIGGDPLDAAGFSDGSLGAPPRKVLPLIEHVVGPPTGLKTGLWRSQTPGYVTPLAPCSGACPAGNDVIAFVRALATEGESVAAEVLSRTNPLAAVCGRVCPAPCMDDCSRGTHDGAVHIRGIERWIADRVPVAVSEVAKVANPRRIAIVGGGPAGLSAAYAAARLGHEATIFEREPGLGGILRTGIPSYRLPREVLDSEIDAILRLGVEARCGVTFDSAALKDLAAGYDAVVIATGLQKLRALAVPGAELAGVEQGIAFLHRQSAGGDVGLRGHVVVLGGGNTALDCARSALRAGAERVTIAYRRTRQEMPAIALEVEEAVDEGVELLFQRQPVAVHGIGRVEAIELAEVDMGEPDESGRRSPVVSDRSARLECDAALLALGQFADHDLLPGGWTIEGGRVHSEGAPISVFVAGDLATGDGTVSHAIGDGRRAALRALDRLGADLRRHEGAASETTVAVDQLRLDYFEHLPAAIETHADPGERTKHYGEVNQGIDAPAEAARCISCGRCTHCDTCLVFCPDGVIRREGEGYEIDQDYCKGCGICVLECPRGCMEMKTK